MPMITRTDLRRSPHRVVLTAPGPVTEEAAQQIHLTLTWDGNLCKAKVTNTGSVAVNVREVVLFSVANGLPDETSLYAEGFQMLSQTGGTLANPVALGGYTDHAHYKLPQPDGALTVYNLLLLTPPTDAPVPRSTAPHEPLRQTHLFAFTSAKRFTGKFHLFSNPRRIDVVQDTEGLELGPGEGWDLEEFQFATYASVSEGSSRKQLLSNLADRLNHHHPRLSWINKEKGQKGLPPLGWCSWYCYGPSVTDAQVLANLDFIARELPALKYVQIDDGYQPAMGDWLETGKAFGGDVRGVLRKIKEKGFEPAIWVAPFIADASSRLFKEHPDWFMQDADGHPLPADKVTFGGWRLGPWYALDGTHPEAQQHLERVFRTMRDEWGCTYFKMDANFWGTMPGGRLHDPKATKVEAYRRGMAAIRRGAGDSFLLGCNHPLWPSLGEIHGSRSSNDIARSWNSFKNTARENLSRAWQNDRLWWIDPDCVLLTGNTTEEEFHFHATAILATGGMILSGDDLTRLSPERLAMLRKMLPPNGLRASFPPHTLQVGASFYDESLSTGSTSTPSVFNEAAYPTAYFVFNWEDRPQSLTIHMPALNRWQLSDFWSNGALGRHFNLHELKDLPPHSARLLKSEIGPLG